MAGVVILAVILFRDFCPSKYTKKDTKPKQNPEEQNTSVSENSTSNESTAENSTDDPDIIVKDNVKVITNEMKSEDQPTEVFDNSLIFEKDPGYQTGAVLVAGEISAAPSGFIRKSSADRKKRIRVTGWKQNRRPCWMYSKRHISSSSSG